MLNAILGYWKLSKKYGLTKAIKFCYSWYYGKNKQKGIDLGAERIITTKSGYKLNLIPNDPGISLELTSKNAQHVSIEAICQVLIDHRHIHLLVCFFLAVVCCVA